MRKLGSYFTHPIYGTFHIITNDFDEDTILYRYEDIKRIAKLNHVRVEIRLRHMGKVNDMIRDGHVDFITEDAAMIMIKEAKATYRWKAKKFIKFCHKVVRFYKLHGKDNIRSCWKM